MCKYNIKLIYLTFIHSTSKLKSINNLSLVKTMNKLSLIKSINNIMHIKSINNLSLVKNIIERLMRVLRRPIVLLRIRCSILILSIKFVRYNIRLL